MNAECLMCQLEQTLRARSSEIRQELRIMNPITDPNYQGQFDILVYADRNLRLLMKSEIENEKSSPTFFARVPRLPPSMDREKNPAGTALGRRQNAENRQPTLRKEPEMTESSEWQRIGDIPVDTGRLVLVDPMNVDDVSHHEDEHSDSASMTYELLTNEHGVAVALLASTGLGDGLYPVEARFEEAEGTIRIAEIRVRFLPHPVIGYELPR